MLNFFSTDSPDRIASIASLNADTIFEPAGDRFAVGLERIFVDGFLRSAPFVLAFLLTPLFIGLPRVLAQFALLAPPELSLKLLPVCFDDC
jgi:hypothetical protein